MDHSRRDVLIGGLALAACRTESKPPPFEKPAPVPLLPARSNGAEPRNVVLILTDDQRHDSLGFLGHPLARTPHLDAMARQGAHLAEAFVTTSLCCPSRASMLTGLYAHAHGVLDNSAELDPHFPTFAQILQGEGIDTAYFGKWHMGARNPHPRPGWSRWVGFRGQGRYHYPGEGEPLDRGFSFDGELREVKGYVTDLLTDLAVDYLKSRDGSKPFVMVLAHKGVHNPFVPAPRHKELFAESAAIPEVLPDDDAGYAGRPRWLRALRRETEFGADHPYQWQDFRSWYLDYHRTLCAVDDSVGRVLAALEERGLSERTVVLFASDNGFLFGEQGVVDKRNFYEASIRIPMLCRAPGLAAPASRIDDFVLGLDIAPTVLELCGFHAPSHWHGRSFVPLLRGERPEDWRSEFLYEYFYERAFPHTPTLFGLRAKRTKLALYHGLSETEELYDLEADPHERVNLIADPAWADRRKAMKGRLARHAAALGLLTEPVWGRNWLSSPEQAARPEGLVREKGKGKR